MYLDMISQIQDIRVTWYHIDYYSDYIWYLYCGLWYHNMLHMKRSHVLPEIAFTILVILLKQFITLVQIRIFEDCFVVGKYFHHEKWKSASTAIVCSARQLLVLAHGGLRRTTLMLSCGNSINYMQRATTRLKHTLVMSWITVSAGYNF